MLLGAYASKRMKGSADQLKPGNHDEAVVFEISIEARWGPAGGYVARPGPGQPVSLIETDLDSALMAIERHQGTEQFGLISRNDDETRLHWPTLADGLVRMAPELRLRNYLEALVPEDCIAGEWGTPARPFPPHAVALVVSPVEPHFDPGHNVENKGECLEQFGPIT